MEMEPHPVLRGVGKGGQDVGLPAVTPVVDVSRPHVTIQHEYECL